VGERSINKGVEQSLEDEIMTFVACANSERDAPEF